LEKLKCEPGKDIWLFGGGSLFRSLLDAQLVDTIELSLAPILISRGTPLVVEGVRSPKLKLVETNPSSTGAVALKYEIEYENKGNRVSH
tara:strand:+ start:166 stop:432 length:267 start_codon:yes stop_codon:yes gene_type:complete